MVVAGLLRSLEVERVSVLGAAGADSRLFGLLTCEPVERVSVLAGAAEV